MIISHRHKFIFFCNGKTGTTSIEKVLAPYDESKDCNHGAPGLWANKHMPPAVGRALLPRDIWDSYFKFVFVRNPYDWGLSAWRYTFSKKRRVDLVDLVHPRQAFRKYRDSNHRKHLSSILELGSEEVDRLHQEMRPFRCFPNASTCLQIHYVEDIEGHRLVDFVGRFESLESDFLLIQDQLGIKGELPHYNVSKSKNTKGFLPAGKQRFAELWAPDFAKLEYSL
ncbi:MAG: sulfotransferase family 2 domain-containing protein [Verrucomicrobiota bacterium]